MHRARRNETLRRSIVVLLMVGAVLTGVTLRVRFLRQEMMSRWHGALEGGALTTQATVDEWFTDRRADAEAFATSIAVHAVLPPAGDPPSRFASVSAPIIARGKFTEAWILDALGRVISHSGSEALRVEERVAARQAIARQRSGHSAVVMLGEHAALLSIAAPVRLTSGKWDGTSPAVVVLRADVVKAFAPWAAGRPNAAMSSFATSSPLGAVIISACPAQAPPVCIEKRARLDPNAPAALALARRDTFGIFTGVDGERVLALARFDPLLGWGVVRRVSYADAVVPLNNEMRIEGAFLLALLALIVLGTFAANRTMRVRGLYAQREATRRLSAVVDASTDGIISLDDSFAITMVNAAVERMLGYARSEIIGHPVFTLFAPEWHAHLLATLRDFAQSSVAHAPLDETERCIARCANGMLMPVDARVSRADVDGVPVYVMGLRDVSERVRTEQFVKGQRQVLEMIARGAPAAATCQALLSVVRTEALDMRCAIYELDEERQVARLVSAAGLPAAVAEALHEMAVGPSAEALGMAIHSDSSVFTPDVESDRMWLGSRTMLLANGIRGAWAVPLRSADGHVIGALGCYYDSPRQPTAREHELAGAAVHLASIALSSARDAASLRRSEASFRSFVENAPAAIYRETRDRLLESTNPAMVELLGYASAPELHVAAARGGLYPDDAARTRLIERLEHDDVVRGMEMEWLHANGSRVVVRVSARAYRDDRGEVNVWEAYAENVTSLRLAEQALRRNEKLAAVGQLISGVAHELNNPLSSIMHFTEDLLADDRSAEDTEALGVIRDQARRSRAIVRDLLSFVRQREANTVPLCLPEVVSATVRGMARSFSESGVRVHVKDEPGSAVVMADRAGIEQVVTNILSNAVQASTVGGDVWVSTRSVGAECELVVEDSGHGISPEVLPRIFDPFFTTKRTGEGTGLGLSVTLGIVEQLGGRIEVLPRSEARGMKFVVTFPRLQGEASDREAGGKEAPVQSSTSAGVQLAADSPVAVARVRLALIIDDEPTIRAALRRYFTRRGWIVEEAADGNAGLARIDELGDRIGVVVSDVRMPGFSGIELHDLLAITRPALLRRFVFSTGDVASAEAASFVQRTRCPVLQKPFELRMLDEIIAGVVEGADAEPVIA